DRAQPLLGLHVEAVAGLDLQVRDAGAARLVAARARERGELLVRRRAGRVRRDADPAGGVRRARHPRCELVAAVAREDEVRMAVDEARDDASPSGVDVLVALGTRALDRGDDAVLDDQRGVAYLAQLGVVR